MSCERITDTTLEAEQLQIELFRKAPPWRKLELLDQLNQSVKLMALSGLRLRFPTASDDALRFEMAKLILGPEMAARVYVGSGE